MRHRLSHLAFSVLAGLSFQAYAFHPLVTDDTGTQGTGGNQLEVGMDYVDENPGHARALGITYTRGLTDTLDAFVGAAYQTSSPRGWGNVGVGLKWRFFEDEASKFSLALKPEILLPVSRADEAAGLGNGELSYGLTLIGSLETGFGELHFNLEAARSNFDDSTITDRKDFWRASVAPVWAVAEGWKLALDLGLMTNPDTTQDTTMGYVELGVVYSPSEQVDLSFGVIRDLMDGPASTTTATAQVTWHF
jgi:hypothetical protein